MQEIKICHNYRVFFNFFLFFCVKNFLYGFSNICSNFKSVNKGNFVISFLSAINKHNFGALFEFSFINKAPKLSGINILSFSSSSLLPSCFIIYIITINFNLLTFIICWNEYILYIFCYIRISSIINDNLNILCINSIHLGVVWEFLVVAFKFVVFDN